MQFMVLAYDGTDPDALERRLQARPTHLTVTDKMKADGHLLYAAALLNDDEQMIGSLLILDVDSSADIEEWLENEPYVQGDVWRDITVTPCRAAPMFTT